MEYTKGKVIVIRTPASYDKTIYDMYMKAGIDIQILKEKDIMIDNGWLEDNYFKTEMLRDIALKIQRNYDMPNNTQALHEAGQKKREENFAMQRRVRNLSNEIKSKRLEMFYQNTVLLLSGYAVYQLRRGV